MTSLGKDEVETYLSRIDLRSPLEEGLNAAVSVMTHKPLSFFSNFFVTKELLSKFGCVVHCTPGSFECETDIVLSTPPRLQHHF